MIEIENKTDFITTFTIVDKDDVVIPYLEVDWVFQLYTTLNRRFEVRCKDGVLSDNAEIQGNDVVCYVNGFDFGCKGDLYSRSYVRFPHPKFADKHMDLSSTPEIVPNVKIV